MPIVEIGCWDLPIKDVGVFAIHPGFTTGEDHLAKSSHGLSRCGTVWSVFVNIR